jgi:heme o synthase
MPPLPLARSLRLGGPVRAGSSLRSLVQLTKPRLATLSVLTTMAAYTAARPEWHGFTTFALLVGTSLSAAGALALNQWWERETDCIMERTRHRPLPAGTVAPGVALAWSTSLAALGVALLAWGVNPPAALVSAATIVLYVFAYTPLKRHSRWATELGAIPGALPPLIGFAAVDGGISAFGWMIFALMVFWQMPHFFAIGWVCRHEYRAAGFPLLPVVDRTGGSTAAWSLGYSVALLFVSILPWVSGFTGPLFGVTALVGGTGLLGRAWQFWRAADDRDAAARRLFRASLVYLPLVLLALVIDRGAI